MKTLLPHFGIDSGKRRVPFRNAKAFLRLGVGNLGHAPVNVKTGSENESPATELSQPHHAKRVTSTFVLPSTDRRACDSPPVPTILARRGPRA